MKIKKYKHKVMREERDAVSEQTQTWMEQLVRFINSEIQCFCAFCSIA